MTFINKKKYIYIYEKSNDIYKTMQTPVTAENNKWLQIRFFTNFWRRIRPKKFRILPESPADCVHLWCDSEQLQWNKVCRKTREGVFLLNVVLNFRRTTKEKSSLVSNS